MNIGLTGGTGFIGQCLLREYAQQHQFIVLCIEPDTSGFFAHPNIRYLHSDFSTESIASALDGCEAIIHLAGLLSTKEREQRLLNYDVNIDTSENVFAAAAQLGISNIVNISSRTVYDPAGPSPHTEDEFPHPLNTYAVAKLAVEHLADLYHRRFGLNIKTLRFAQVFGAGGRNGYMMEVFRQRCLSGQPLEVTDAQGKELLYVKDAARAALCASLCPKAHGIYNIGTGTFLTNREIAETFCRVYDNGAGVLYRGDPSDVTRPAYMDVSRARRELGFSAAFTLEEALADMRSAEAEEKGTDK